MGSASTYLAAIFQIPVYSVLITCVKIKVMVKISVLKSKAQYRNTFQNIKTKLYNIKDIEVRRKV